MGTKRDKETSRHGDKGKGFLSLLPCFVVTLSAFWLCGCAYHNTAINPQHADQANHTRSTIHIPDDRGNDGFFVGLALSGGGSRSANFAAACMFELQQLGILERVDCISAVSGGCLPAAYYCLNDEQWIPDNVRKRMRHAFAGDIISAVLRPWNMIALAVSPWSRTDGLAESLTSTLYSRDGRPLTFSDLREDRPRLYINATDMQAGAKFIFCNERFAQIGSDLGEYRVAYAVAASSAVPALLHHVTLVDHSAGQGKYRRLLDGGIVDNLGMTTLAEVYEDQVRRAIEAGRDNPYPNGMILIMIDARTNARGRLGDTLNIGVVESLAAAIGLTSTTLLNRVSSAAMTELVVKTAPTTTPAGELIERIDQLKAFGSLSTVDRWSRPLRIVHIDLTRIDDLPTWRDTPQASAVTNMETYFNIGEEQADLLERAARDLIGQRFSRPLAQIATELGARQGTSP